MRRRPASAGGGGFVLLAVTILVSVFAIMAATGTDDVSIVGTVYGPCGTAPSSTVDVYDENGDLAGSGVIGVSNWADTCSGTISVDGVTGAIEYTLRAGRLSAWISADHTGDAVTIRMETG